MLSEKDHKPAAFTVEDDGQLAHVGKALPRTLLGLWQLVSGGGADGLKGRERSR